MTAASISQGTAARLVEVKNILVNALGELNSIWDDIGLLEDQKEKRLDLAFMYIRNLIEEMVTEDERRRNTLKENIEIYKSKLSTLCAELGVAPIQPVASRLCEVEAELKQSVSCWEKEKEKRLRELYELTKIEQALCDSMYMTPTYISRDSVPSTAVLQQLQKRTDELAAEKATRYKRFMEARQRITEILTDIGQEAMTEFEQDVAIEEPECFVLSESNMIQLKETTGKLEMQLTEKVKAKKSLMEKIIALWTRLEIPKAEQDKVQQDTVDHTPASLQKLDQELQRCQKMKTEHLQEFTEKLRRELSEWWDKCYYSKQQRAAFAAYKCEEYSEELLIQHEDALEAVKFFYAENEQLLQKIEKRRVLWNRMVEFDAKENDANRFRNRGGNLLAEEKAKKKVMHQLPKVEEQLKQEIEEWERENDRQFLIGGVQFFEFCRLEWEEYRQSKELQKQQRHEMKKAKSCISLASPTLKNPVKGRTAMRTTTKGQLVSRKVDQENTTPSSSCSADDLVSLSSQSSEVEPVVSSYEEFENVLDSAAKTKQCRSTMCPKNK
ncbi:protein regulator of cytokinesis 1-like isoform X2 [Watersipora subatra]|uniref:protein regulator of cytokinesis 1-like isoform X2 n=1 Tax=Watersipora subatra TaxID=2589382 RepID=UPI00355C8604